MATRGTRANLIEQEQAQQQAAIIRGRDYGRQLYELSERQRGLLDDLDGALRLLRETDRDSADLDRFTRRIERLHELRRSEEYGSLMLELDRALDEYWRRIAK